MPEQCEHPSAGSAGGNGYVSHGCRIGFALGFVCVCVRARMRACVRAWVCVCV